MGIENLATHIPKNLTVYEFLTELNNEQLKDLEEMINEVKVRNDFLENELYVIYDIDGNVVIGEVLSTETKMFRDLNGALKEYKDIHDELNPGNNTNNFIEYLAGKFQNKFHNNTSVMHEDYEFKIYIPRYYPDMVISLDAIEEIMNDVLEDWWSVQWEELKYNKIEVRRDLVLVSFRVHDVHEVQFRYNDREVK